MVLQFFGEVRAKTFIVRLALVAFPRRARRNAPTPSPTVQTINEMSTENHLYERTNENETKEEVGALDALQCFAIVFNFLYIGFAVLRKIRWFDCDFCHYRRRAQFSFTTFLNCYKFIQDARIVRRCASRLPIAAAIHSRQRTCTNTPYSIR